MSEDPSASSDLADLSVTDGDRDGPDGGRLTIHPADDASIGDVEALLAAADLPTACVAARPDRFVLGVVDGVVVGAGGLEVHGSVGLLRSIVVAGDARGQGYGSAIAAALEERAVARGVETLYLLTTTAEAFFRRLGFEVVPRSDVPAAIRETRQFATDCPDTAICMRRAVDR